MQKKKLKSSYLTTEVAMFPNKTWESTSLKK